MTIRPFIILGDFSKAHGADDERNADSVPETEYEETMSKAKAMLKAVEIAQRGF
jgi:hypothetical protein